MSEADFERLMVNYVCSNKLDYSRPMWNSVFLPNFENGPCVVLAIHHSVIDGIGIWKVLDSLCDNG
jgi:NRPS condensation-like uncharacterized protein